MVPFDDERAAFAQLFHFVFEAVVDHADQRADDEDAADRNAQHHEAKTQAGIAAHRAGVEGAHQAFPQRFRKGEWRAAFLRDPAQAEDGRGHGDDRQG